MDHWRNQRGNQNMPRDKWKQKYSDPKPVRCRKAALSGKFTAIQPYPLPQETLKKKKKHPQINNLALHLKQTEKEQQQQKNPQS